MPVANVRLTLTLSLSLSIAIAYGRDYILLRASHLQGPEVSNRRVHQADGSPDSLAASLQLRADVVRNSRTRRTNLKAEGMCQAYEPRAQGEIGRGRWETQVQDWAWVKHPPRTPVDLVFVTVSTEPLTLERPRLALRCPTTGPGSGTP